MAGEVGARQRERKLFSGSPFKDGAREIMSGSLSGFVCKTFEYPFDTVKVLQQTSPVYGKLPFYRVIYNTASQGGVRALYQGLTSPLVGAMFENATLFLAYGAMKSALGVSKDPSLSNPVPMWKLLVSGAGSGLFSAFVLTPVELVKCRLQIQQGAGTREYSGPIDVIAKTVRAQGVQGLWRGNLACLMREVPGNLAWFGTYETVRRTIQRSFDIDKVSDVPLYFAALSGACAGVMYWAVPFPADTVKSKIQTDAAYAGMSVPQAFRKVVAGEGYGALYKGLGVTCLRAAPSHALIFLFYEIASGMLNKF
jgi:ornithine carrier protein